MLSFAKYFLFCFRVKRELKSIALSFGAPISKFPEVKAALREGFDQGRSEEATQMRCASAAIEVVVSRYSPEVRIQIIGELSTIDYDVVAEFLKQTLDLQNLEMPECIKSESLLPVTLWIGMVIYLATAGKMNELIGVDDCEFVLRQIYGGLYCVPAEFLDSINTDYLLPVSEEFAVESIAEYRGSLSKYRGAQFEVCMEKFEGSLLTLEDDSSVDFREAGIRAYRAFADELIALLGVMQREEADWLAELDDKRLYSRKEAELQDFLEKSRELLASWGHEQFEKRILEIANSKPENWDPSARMTPASDVNAHKAVQAGEGNSIGDLVFARAQEICAERGESFEVGQYVPAHTIPASSNIDPGHSAQEQETLRASGAEVITPAQDIPAQYPSYSGANLHAMKKAFDDLLFEPAVQVRYGVGVSSVESIRQARIAFIDWVTSTNPAYKHARDNYVSQTKVINRMMIGQYIEGIFREPGLTDFSTVQGVGAFSDAVRVVKDALVNATGLPYGSELEYLMTTKDFNVLVDVLKDLASEVREKELASLSMGRPIDGYLERKSQYEAYESLLTEAWLFTYEFSNGLVPESDSDAKEGYGPVDFDYWRVWKRNSFERTSNLWFNYPRGLPPQMLA